MNLKLANDIASNVLQTVFLYQPYMSEHGLKNIKAIPIIIEGLDCVGKNTLSKTLFDKLKSENKNVILLSFPNYESDSGKEILQILHTEGTRSGTLEQNLRTLMIRNRMETLRDMRNDIDIEENKDKTFYIIFDRFFLSNLAYFPEPSNKKELLELINESPIYKLAEWESDTYFSFLNNNGEGTSVILSYNENDPDKAYNPGIQEFINKSKSIHKEFLDKKLNKDTNENMTKQAIVSSIYDIEGIDKKFHKVKYFLRYRPAESLTNIMKDKIIPQILELIK